MMIDVMIVRVMSVMVIGTRVSSAGVVSARLMT